MHQGAPDLIAATASVSFQGAFVPGYGPRRAVLPARTPAFWPPRHPDVWVLMGCKPLATLATDNGLHQNVIGPLRPGADARDKPIQVHQRGSRRGRLLRSRPRLRSRNPPLR